MMTCGTLRDMLAHFSLIRECDQVGEWLRLSTAFRYPDGSYIDVFVRSGDDGRLRLSDLGTTATWLLDMQIEWWATPHRKLIVADTCTLLQVREDNGEFLAEVDPPQLGDGIVRLSQVCLRVADLMFTKSARADRVFPDEVKRVLVTRGLKYESNIGIPGKHRENAVDFLVFGRTRKSLVNTLSAERAGTAKQQVDSLVVKWVDVKAAGRPDGERLVSIYDDRKGIFKPKDVGLLQEVSDRVLPFSQQQEIGAYLAN